MGGFFTITYDPVNGLEDLRSSLLAILLRWWDTHKGKWSNVDAITQCMMQMVLFKIRSLQEAMNGMPLVPNGQKQTIYLDLANISSITRGLYEAAFIFHNIFIATQNKDERDVLINIWKIEGLNNRNKVPVPDTMDDKVISNNQEIETLRNETREILGRMNIQKKAIDKIERVIKKNSSNIKGYDFVRIDDRIIDFKSVDFSDSQNMFNSEYMAGTYSFLSYHSHPSYLSLLQFGQLTGKENLNELGFPFLFTACMCASKFINDACDILSDGNRIKGEVAPNIRSTINFFSGM